jgi:hypothetical protein
MSRTIAPDADLGGRDGDDEQGEDDPVTEP